jgi:atypical dual specificity phosphatase
VLLHCAAGISRSVSLMAAYLMHRTRWQLSAYEALTYIRTRRRIASPNIGFCLQLVRIRRHMLGKSQSCH